MKNTALAIASLGLALVGCTFGVPQDGSKTDETSSLRGDDDDGAGDTAERAGTKTSTDPTTPPAASVNYAGPFVIGDGSGETDGDAQCFRSLGVTKPPSTGRKAFAIELYGDTTEVQVRASKLCGGRYFNDGYVLLVKDGAVLVKERFDFANAEDLVADATVHLAAAKGKSFAPGSYSVVLTGDRTSGTASENGLYNDFALDSLELAAVGERAQIAKRGDGADGPRAEITWSGAFSIGDNALEDATGDAACRSSLGAGRADGPTKRFSFEIGGDVTDLAVEVAKACGSRWSNEVEVRVYEGDALLLTKKGVRSSGVEQVSSLVMHVNADSASRPLAPGKYTVEIAAQEKTSDVTNSGRYQDTAAAGITVWAIGDGATIAKR